jgi:hypothetical protein
MWHLEDRASWYIFIIKPTRYTNFSNLFWNRTLHVSDSFTVHHQVSSTVHTATGICHTGYVDCLLAFSTPVWHIPIAVCTVLDSWWWTEKLSETCRVLFQKWIWEISVSRWFYYQKKIKCVLCLPPPPLLPSDVWGSGSIVLVFRNPRHALLLFGEGYFA